MHVYLGPKEKRCGLFSYTAFLSQRFSSPSTSSFRKKKLLGGWQSRFPRSINKNCSFLTESSYHYYVFMII